MMTTKNYQQKHVNVHQKMSPASLCNLNTNTDPFCLDLGTLAKHHFLHACSHLPLQFGPEYIDVSLTM